jgi:Tfp pilus assembly protein PilZ
MTRMLKVRYRNGGEFLDHYQSSFLYGGLFYPTREAVALGTPVVLEVRFPELEDRMILRGFVAWRRQGRYRLGQRAGLGIEFLAAERLKRDFLLSVARGEMAREVAPRRHRRLPIELRVDWRVKDARDRHSATLDDIGPGGAFLRTRDLAPEGTSLVIEVVPPGGAAPLAIEGRVAWSRESPGEEGLGVEFRCRDTGGLRRLKELVRRLEESRLGPSAKRATVA